MADHDSRAGTRYATPAILDDVNTTHAAHDLGLARAFAVPAGVPAIQVGPSEGRLLHLLLRLSGVRTVVEVGTLMGYSTIHPVRWSCRSVLSTAGANGGRPTRTWYASTASA